MADSDKELCICHENEKYLTIAAKRKLMSTCLYGIDIAPLSVEVTKMSLALRMLISKWNKVDKLCNELYGLTESDWNEIKKVGRELNRVTGKEVGNESRNETAAKKIH